jgi:hypothetical protein
MENLKHKLQLEELAKELVTPERFGGQVAVSNVIELPFYASLPPDPDAPQAA